MTKETAWAHLPNARHIDWVLADVKTRPQVWGAAWDARLANRDGAFDASDWDVARGAAREVAWYAARGAARDAARGAAQRAAQDAVAALVAWDHAGDLLTMTEQQLRAHSELSEAPAAILLLPAVVARESGDSTPERHAQELAAYALTVSNLRAQLEQKDREDFQAGYEAGVYDAKYVDAACANQDASKMADFFMGWALPKDFSPDCGISFDGREDDEWNKNKMWPTGTNLFTHEQAKTLFEQMLAAAPQPAAQPERPTNCGTGHCSCIECVMQPELTDDEILAINAGEVYFSTSESKWGRDVNPHTQYNTGEPGLIDFSRAVIAAYEAKRGAA